MGLLGELPLMTQDMSTRSSASPLPSVVNISCGLDSATSAAVTGELARSVGGL